MNALSKHFLIICLAVCNYGHAQTVNDSVFNPSVLSAMQLTDSKNGGMVFLPEKQADQPVLFIFLSPECPLCQNYTRVLNQLYREYGNRIAFYGIIPGKTYDAKTINGFAKKYSITYPLYIDRALKLSRYLRATATPEVILLNKNELVYKGAIDDWFADIGKQRARATKNFLRDALSRELNGKTVAFKRTKAVGCYINDY
jgi:thiol-disulfide isomerase/thioredoxin